ICAEEITSIGLNFSPTLTCTSPAYTPIGAGTQGCVDVYNPAINWASSPPSLCFSYDASFEYEYMNQGGSTFLNFCEIKDNSTCLDLPSGVTLCACGLDPTYTVCCTCDPTSITTTPTLVIGELGISFTVTDLCVPTVFCVSTIACP
ncbi:MAG: hypothetical protein U9N81_10630, partial [Bacillota bacterium]|nr:hypothetical protein [Bacillota bacterium]